MLPTNQFWCYQNNHFWCYHINQFWCYQINQCGATKLISCGATTLISFGATKLITFDICRVTKGGHIEHLYSRTEIWSVSPSVNMLPFGVTIPATVQQRSEISEGLTNYPVYSRISTQYVHTWKIFLPDFKRMSYAVGTSSRKYSAKLRAITRV